ncbi:AraC family transcriptional regulator [Pseudalgibacter alginicilyticus]|uniref:AraC family transcriptional regulator n=1 Tax=Pseudalgibacter alginicilyticus TaxID=1736674 RepID=UPI001F2E91D7|nr:AraC family transcriptional regulator [Pseudalgibacter alginicilyticus]
MIRTNNKISSIDDIKIAPFDVSKRYTRPHRHNKYLEIIFFSKGEGFHHLDSKSYVIKPPMIFVVKKEEVHNWEINSVPKGYVIIIKETFLEKTLDKYINLQLVKLQTVPKIELHKKDATIIKSLFKVLCKEKQQVQPQAAFIEGVLKALLGKIISNSYAGRAKDNIDKAKEFMELLIDKPRNNVAFYADRLNVTSQNLNQLCKKQYDKTPSEIIAIEIIKEVKRLLNFTNKTISEIAFELDFKDVSHFVKYFKRHTGRTPLQIKKELLNIP